MKQVIIGSVITIICIIFGTVCISQCVNANIEWTNDIGYAWDLADKSSTLAEKSKYIDEFIFNLKESKHNKYGALVYKTRSYDFDLNLKALETLGERLHEIQKIDVNSFAYQTAIQQITAQEQGEAQEMIKVLYGAWVIDNYWWAFYVVQLWVWILIAILGCVAFVLFAFGFSDL